MTSEQREQYESTDTLRKILTKVLSGRKFKLDCHHHVTFGYYLGNNVTIYNGKEFKIICSLCGY